MTIAYLLIGIIGLILLALTILMPVFVYSISSRANDILQRANEQMEWNKSQLEAQNLILKELYNIRIK